ncbi:MAG: hypothetical protein ACI8PQ_000710 [Planctomycetota bacterium]|jgi:hypothetical protein
MAAFLPVEETPFEQSLLEAAPRGQSSLCADGNCPLHPRAAKTRFRHEDADHLERFLKGRSVVLHDAIERLMESRDKFLLASKLNDLEACFPTRFNVRSDGIPMAITVFAPPGGTLQF